MSPLPRIDLNRFPALHRKGSVSCRLVIAMALVFFYSQVLSAQNDVAMKASQLMQAGNFHDAELLWRQLAQSYPKNAEIHSNLAVSLAQQAKLEQAAVEYRKSLAIKPDQPEVQYNLALAEFKQGHFSAAVPLFEVLAQKKPEDHRPTVLLGMSFFGLRDYAKASQYLQAAIQFDPSNLELHNVLAESCLWSRQYDCALTEFRNILAVNP